MQSSVDTQSDASDAATSALNATPSLPPREALGEYLSSRREEGEMSVEQISRTTKIPKTSLLHLEAGRFDRLPGDVFVRGFLRSYARCLKLDADDVVSRYAQCGLNPAPVSSQLAETVLAHNTSDLSAGRPRRFPKATRPLVGSEAEATQSADADSGAVPKELAKSESVRNVVRDAFDVRNWQRSSAKQIRRSAPVTAEAATEAEAPQRCRTFIPPRIDFNDEMSNRGPLTLGVIILVIVATLTMSYLLRRPGTSVDGFTMAPDSMAPGSMAPGSMAPGPAQAAVLPTPDARDSTGSARTLRA